MVAMTLMPVLSGASILLKMQQLENQGGNTPVKTGF